MDTGAQHLIHTYMYMCLPVGLLPCLGVIALSTACTDPGGASTPNAASARGAVAPESPNGRAMESLFQHFEQEGYQRVMRNGQTVFCRKQIMLSSRTPAVLRETCATASELQLAEQPKGRRTDVLK